MKEPVVVDSTCLIGLEGIDHLHLLSALFEPIIIPPEVEHEFGRPLPWLKLEAPVDHALIATLKILVDDGEAEAIALASEKSCRIILDDRQARVVARRLGLAITGTVGLLLRAKCNGVIPAIKPLLEGLEQNNFYLSEALRAEALKLAGE